jgi:hypothetical protein
MSSTTAVTIITLWLLAGATRPAFADTPAPARDPAMAAGTPFLRDTAASPSAASWAPSADALDALRARIGDHAIHLWNGSDHIAVRHARLDSSGVHFELWKQDYAPWVYDGWRLAAPRSEAGGGGSAGSSRIPWARISRIETQQSRVLLGAAAGTLLGLAALGMASSSTDMWSDMGALVLAPAIVVSFGLLGAVAGGLVPGRSTAWQRTTATRRTTP